MNDTINIISTKPITKEEFYSTELQARQHVPFNASWVAFEIPKGITQCKDHEWIKLNDREIKCTKCPTVNIIDPLKINNYINQNGNK